MTHTPLGEKIQHAAQALDLSIAFVQPDFSQASQGLKTWLAAGMHGSMDYLARHADLRQNPQNVFAPYQSMIMARLPYIYEDAKHTFSTQSAWQELNTPGQAVISWYARGRDYHKVFKKQLKQLGEKIADEAWFPHFLYRPFTDSAPIMEVEAAQQTPLGWRGKHTLLLHPKQGSLFFLGGMLHNIPLHELVYSQPAAQKSHCGTCQRCIDVCPTKAIVAPYVVDARRCIAYLTIEHTGAIEPALRPLIGAHIYGCDECQLICPWNKFAKTTTLHDFKTRGYSMDVLEFLQWDEEKFLNQTQGSSMRRIYFSQWQRNAAIVAGNYLRHLCTQKNMQNSHQNLSKIQALLHILKNIHPCDAMVEEHILWACAQAEQEHSI